MKVERPKWITDNPRNTRTVQDRHQREMRSWLQQGIDIELQEATIRQMAETLQVSTGLPIRVDQRVPRDTQVTVEAHSVPLAQVLEAISQKAHLLIDFDNAGLVLTLQSFLRVGSPKSGTTMSGYGRSVWSERWGTPPTDDSNLRPATSESKKPGADFNIGSGPSGVTATALGVNRFVVIEPGVGPEGGKGVWLTVYRINEDGSIKRQGTVFHPMTESGVQTARGPSAKK